MGKKVETEIKFDPASRKSFLLSVQHSKTIKKKKAQQKEEELLRETRRELRKEKKDTYRKLAQDLIEKQKNIGIKPLSLIKDAVDINIPMIEIDTTNNKIEKQNKIVNIKDSK